MTTKCKYTCYFYFSVPVKRVEAVLGGVAELPCSALPSDAHDDVYLILWFKDDARYALSITKTEVTLLLQNRLAKMILVWRSKFF